MATKLYVGNLSYRLTNEELEAIFAEFGTVESAFIITDRETRRSKGFGFVEMSTEEEAQAAINALHESEQQGRNMIVNVARPKEER